MMHRIASHISSLITSDHTSDHTSPRVRAHALSHTVLGPAAHTGRSHSTILDPRPQTANTSGFAVQGLGCRASGSDFSALALGSRV
eukprot:236081-Rhodomonas_salina.1